MANVSSAPAAPTSIKAYLDALKLCLKGQPPGLIQDALDAHGSVGKVAKMFGVNRTTIFRKLQLREPRRDRSGGGRKD